jgi:hypothetical protein
MRRRAALGIGGRKSGAELAKQVEVLNDGRIAKLLAEVGNAEEMVREFLTSEDVDPLDVVFAPEQKFLADVSAL